MRIGDGRLLQVLVDAAAAADELGFEFDGHPGAVRLVDPLDAMLFDVVGALFAGRNVDSFPFAVEDSGLVLLGVDLDFVVVGRFPGRDFRDDFDRLAGGLHAVHAGGADADALLAATLAQAVELGAVEQLAEDQRDLLLEDAGAVVLDADLVAVVGRSARCGPRFPAGCRLLRRRRASCRPLP